MTDAMPSGEGGEITRLLVEARQDGSSAAARLYELLYGDLRRLARARLRAHRTLTMLGTTALVHESFMRFANLGQLQLVDRKHFLAYAATTMRSIIVDLIRHKQAERSGGGQVNLPLDTDIASDLPKVEDDVLRVGEAIEDLAKVDARAAKVVELRYFAGMADWEIAEILGVTERTVYRDWRKAKLLLLTALS